MGNLTWHKIVRQSSYNSMYANNVCRLAKGKRYPPQTKQHPFRTNQWIFVNVTFRFAAAKSIRPRLTTNTSVITPPMMATTAPLSTAPEAAIPNPAASNTSTMPTQQSFR